MMKCKVLLPTMIVVLQAMAAHAANENHAIRVESIAAAMSAVGMPVAPGQVTLLADVVSTSNAPRLVVRSIVKSTDHRLTVRFECERSEECLPFFARINSGVGSESQLPAPTMKEQSPGYSSSDGRAKPDEIKAGTKATLLLDGDHLHISLSVICLENGTPGKRIRVAAGEHRQIYLAEVINGKLLKGSL